MNANKVESADKFRIEISGTILVVIDNLNVDRAAFLMDQMNEAERFAIQLVNEAYAAHKRQQAVFRRSPSTFNSFVLNLAPELWGRLCA